MARGGSSGGRAAQSRGQPGAALGEASGRMEFPASPEEGSQMSFYGPGTRFSPSCEGREHGGLQLEADDSPPVSAASDRATQCQWMETDKL